MATQKRRAPRTRNFLAAIKSKVARKGASSEEIVSALLREHPEAVRAETDDLVHYALIKLANEACSLKSGPSNNLQLEMFSEYATPRMILLRVEDAKGRVSRVHKAVDSLTKVEARQYVEDHTKPRPKLSPKVVELARLVSDMEKYGEDFWTLGQCWKAAHP